MAAKKSKYKWQDTSSYPRGTTEREPDEWQLDLPHNTLILYRKHGEDPDQWFGTCHQLGIIGDDVGTLGMSADRAKAWLIELCIDRCTPRLNELVAARGAK